MDANISSDGMIWVPQSKPTLQEAQEFVGGYVELVHLRDGSQLIVNEEGHLMGLPYNDKASMLYGGVIVGKAILLRGKNKWD